MAFDSNIKGYMTFGKSFSRGGAFPLEAYEIWTDYDALVAYAANTNPDKDPSYIGQKVAYVDKTNGKVTHYGIECDGSLKELGVTPLGDDKTIEVSASGVISLFGGADAPVGTLPMIDSDQESETYGKIVWKTLEDIGAGDGNDNTTYTFTPVTKTTGEGDTAVTETVGFVVKTFFNGNEVEGGSFSYAPDFYTKAEVDAKIAAIDFVDTDELNNAIKDFVTDNDLSTTLADYATTESVNTTLADYATTEDVNTTLADYAKTEDVNTALSDKADADDLTALAEKVDAFLTGTGTEEALDSLQELIAYIETHDDADISGILASIQALENKVVLGTYTDGEETKEYATVKAYVEAAIDALKIGDYAKAADLTELAGRVSTLEAKPFDTYATKDEVNAKADASALENYYTKTNIDEILDNYVTTGNFNDSIDQLNDSIDTITATYATKKELSDHADAAALAYATKDELKATDDVAKDAQNRVDIVEGKIDEITSVGGEPNVIEKIKVNGVTLEVEKDSEGKSTKTVSISVPTSIVGMDGYSALDGRVTTNTNAIAALEGQLGTTNTNVSGITTRLAALEAEVGEVDKSRIDALEGVTAQHTTDIGANTAAITTINTSSIPALEAAIAAEAKARQDADKAINDKIGEVEEGKTIVDMINAVEGTIDFTPYATNARVDEIYKVDGETETGLLPREIARAKAAEEANAKAITDLTNGAVKDNTDAIAAINALLNTVDSEDAITSLKELALWVEEHETEVLPVIEANSQAISALQGKVDTGDKTVTEYIADYHTANQYVLPKATADVLGGVKSATDVVNGETTSVAINKVYVDATTNVGEVKAISTDILVNGSEELVLFGGNAGVNA